MPPTMVAEATRDLQGSFGEVYVYRNVEDDELVAIKFLPLDMEISKYVEREILNHRILRHPHVIEFNVSDRRTGGAF